MMKQLFIEKKLVLCTCSLILDDMYTGFSQLLGEGDCTNEGPRVYAWQPFLKGTWKHKEINFKKDSFTTISLSW